MEREQRNIKTIQELYELAGSSTKLAAMLELHAYTVENWRRSGVPYKYWDCLMKKLNVTSDDLFRIWKSCKENKRR